MTSPIHNIVDSVINPSNNIIYQKHNSCFDLIIQTLDYNFFDEQEHESGLGTNLWVSNDPINFSQKSIHSSNDAHVNSVLFFHNVPPLQFKKEDIIIFKQYVEKKYKILCSSSLSSSWLPSDDKWHSIDYGIPNLMSTTTIRNNNIVMLNFNNNPTISSLCSNIQQNIPKTLVLNSLPNNLDELYSILQDSIICIDFENIINSMVASVCECFVIVPYDNPSLTHYAKINNTTDLLSITKKALDNIDISKITQQKNMVLDQFSFDIFTQRVTLIFNSIIKEKFIL